MKPHELLLASKLLKLAREEFGRHGCNDVDQKELGIDSWTDEQKIEFAKGFGEYNGDPFDNPSVQEFNRLPDYALMGFMASKLRWLAHWEKVKQ